MEKLNFSNLGLQGVEPMSREEMKAVSGGGTSWDCYDVDGNEYYCTEYSGGPSCIEMAEEADVELSHCLRVLPD